MKEKVHSYSPNLIFSKMKPYLLLTAIIFWSLNSLNAQNSNANSNGLDHANENATVEGGVVSTMEGATETDACIGDDVEDIVDFHVEGASGRLKQWVITDDEDNILYLPEEPSFDFNDEGEEGTLRVYHLSYNGMKPLVQPFWHKHIKNLFTDLRGKYDISDNYITINLIQQPEGGDIALDDGSTEIEICAGDGISDLFEVTLTGASGGQGVQMIWVVTDTDGNIIETSDMNSFDFEEDGDGISLIWHLSYAENVSLEGVTNAADLTGCFDLSNPITVIRNGVNAGSIEIANGGGTAIEICAGDGISDAFDVEVMGDLLGDNMGWVITNNADDPEILALPDGPPFDLEGAGDGICLIWHIAYEDGLEGAAVGNNVSALSGCFALSNAIEVTRNGVNAGSIAIANDGGTEIEICAGDGNSDAFDVEVTGDLLGDNMAWVITNNADDPEILALPDGPPFDLEEAGDGTCLIWHIAFEDGLEGVAVGNMVSGLSGCFSLSNAITVIRNAVDGGTITGGTENSFSFTVGDGTADMIAEGEITLEGNVGDNSAWVVTNEDGSIILSLPENYWDVNFDEAPAGTCLVWHLSYEDGLEGLTPPDEGDHLVSSLSGCFSLSNSISVVRAEASGKVALYPNPSKGSVNINYSGFKSDAVNISIFNLSNYQISNKNYSSLDKKTLLDVSTYDNGIYFVKVTDGVTGESVIKRLIVDY